VHLARGKLESPTGIGALDNDACRMVELKQIRSRRICFLETQLLETQLLEK
jgi:hypothetical protein